MFQVQSTLLQVLPESNALLDKYSTPSAVKKNSELDDTDVRAKNFVMRVPLVGGFSAGKSRLLNAFVQSSGGENEPLFSTEVTPETAVPAELGYGIKESFIGRFSDGSSIALTRKQVRENNLVKLQCKSGGDINSWVEVLLDIPLLSQLPHLRLVDMPGWNSNSDAHNRAIDAYVKNSLAYCVVVSAEEGTLREDIRKVLAELALHNMPLVVVITKADKRTADDIEAIKSKVTQELQTIAGKPPLRVVAVSAVSKRIGVGEFTQALNDLEGMAEPVFRQAVVDPWLIRMGNLQKRIETLGNDVDLDSEKISAKLKDAEANFERFNSQLQSQTDMLQSRLTTVLDHIADRIKGSLNAQLSTLTNTAANGGNLNEPINVAVRLAVTQGIEQDFKPEVQRYLKNVSDVVPQDVVVDLSHTMHRSSSQIEQESGIDWKKGVMAALPAMIAIPVGGPIVAAVLGVVGVFAAAIFGNKSSTPRIDPEEQRRENIRQELAHNTFPSAASGVCSTLRPILQKQIEDAKNAIKDSVKSEQDAHQKTLQRLQAELQQGQSTFAEKQSVYQADLNMLNALVSQVKNA